MYILVDFEPVEPMKTRAYWSTVVADLPFVGMDTDLCKHTQCPVVKDVQRPYNYTLDISKSFPAVSIITLILYFKAY